MVPFQRRVHIKSTVQLRQCDTIDADHELASYAHEMESGAIWPLRLKMWFAKIVSIFQQKIQKLWK